MHPITNTDLLVLDLDQTVRGNAVANWRPPNDTGEQFIYPGVAQVLATYVDSGVTVKFATNQGGIEAGHITRMKTEEILEETMDLLNKEIGREIFDLDDVAYCPAVNRNHPNRKPNPGMLDGWAKYEGIGKSDEARLRCTYIGDRNSDQQAAHNAGFEFMWAWDFFENVPERPENKR